MMNTAVNGSLLPESKKSLVKIDFTHGCSLTVDLANESDVRTLLQTMKCQSLQVITVRNINTAEDAAKLKNAWKKAVAADQTDLAFDDYMRANA